MNQSNIDTIVASYEKAFANDQSVNIREFIPDNLSNKHEVLTELIRVDMELRWNSSRRLTIEDYSHDFAYVSQNENWFLLILFEEYRLRVSNGEDVTPFDYQEQYSVNVNHWPVLSTNDSESGDKPSQDDFFGIPDSKQVTNPDLVARIVDGKLATVPTSESLLHSRLKFFSLAVLVSLAYLSILAWVNPVTKVGLFLGSPWLLWINGICLALCTVISVLLWSRSRIHLTSLRILELILFGSILAELSCGIISDLFFDRELSRPITEGEHSLFHYASSWSLPFFALIVAYGTLIPSSWLRCTVVVVVIAVVPIAVCTVAAIALHEFSMSFFQSFFLQMLIWMASACLIAIFGVRRLEETQDRFSKSGKLGAYQLIRQIATGGMGQVFLAEHRLLRRKCAVKLMHSKWSSDINLLTRFEREVQVLAGISHPNVVQVYDFGFTNDGVFYYVMEFLEGMDFKKSVELNGPYTYIETVETLIQLADALSVIHNGGIVHRDLKPGNVFAAKSGGNVTAKILDFGLLKFESDLGGDAQLTEAGAIIGTPAYMSPEQAVGKDVDHRTDIYSLGAIGYFLLTGRDVFERSTSVETLNDHIKTAPNLAIPEGDNPSVLEPVLLRCLAKDRRCRFQSAQELSEALKRSKSVTV